LCLQQLAAAHDAGRLQFFTVHAALADTRAFAAYLAPLHDAELVVYAKEPFGGPEQVLRYMARYTHRVAIANSRLVAIDHEGVSFKWKDYRVDGPERIKVMTLAPEEFIRRFLIHVLPASFHRIRHYGLLASSQRRQNIARARQLLKSLLRNHSPCPPKTSLLPTRRPCVRVRVAADACSSSKFSRAVVPLDTPQRRQSGTCGSTPHDLFPPATSSKSPSPVSSVLDRPRRGSNQHHGCLPCRRLHGANLT
jgi:hypothetical protein